MATAKKATVPSTKKTETAPTMEPVQAAVKVGQETVDSVVKTSTEVAKKGVEKAVAMGQEQVAAAVKVSNDAYKGYEDMLAFQRSNIEAFVKSNEILSTGVKEINSAIYKLAQANIEETVDLAQKLMGCKSVSEAVELQNSLAKKQYTTTMEQSRKLSDLSVQLAEQATKPIAERVTIAVETLSKPIAA